ncbi:hypothetical protein [Streptomyces sp. NPDC049813]
MTEPSGAEHFPLPCTPRFATDGYAHMTGIAPDEAVMDIEDEGIQA